MRQRIQISLCTLAVSVGLLGATAHLADAREVVLVVLDTTGSMATASSGGTRLQVAQANIVNFLTPPSSSPDNLYALWFFDGTTYRIIDDFATGDTAKNRVIADVRALPVPGAATPLAGTLCAGVDALRDHSLPADIKRMFVASDGEENNTSMSDPCFGPASTIDTPPFSGPPPVTTPASWQWKVYNKVCSGAPDSAGFCPGSSEIIDVVQIFDFASVTGHSLVRTEAGGHTADRFAAVTPSSNLDTALFSSLAHATHGVYRAITLSTPPAVANPIPGDANGDGCVDLQDRTQVINDSGTPGNGIDDFNFNGTVDNADLETVLQHAGQGCWSGSATPNLKTVDNGTACTTMTVSTAGLAAVARLDISGSHAFRSVLRGTLAHNGVTVDAFPVGTFPAGAGTFSFTSRAVPGLPGDASGAWTLCIVDTDAFGDTGVLNTWSVHH